MRPFLSTHSAPHRLIALLGLACLLSVVAHRPHDVQPHGKPHASAAEHCLLCAIGGSVQLPEATGAVAPGQVITFFCPSPADSAPSRLPLSPNLIPRSPPRFA